MKIKTTMVGLVFFLSLLTLYSQEESDKFLLGGEIGFMYTKTKGDNDLGAGLNSNKTISMSGSPLIGLFISKKSVIGLSIEYSISNTNYENGFITYTDIKNYLVSPFFRYYLPHMFFGQLQFNYGVSDQVSKVLYMNPLTNTQMELPYKNKYATTGLGVGIGYSLKITDNVFVEPMLRYVSNYLNDKNTDKWLTQSSFFVNMGIIANIKTEKHNP